MAEYARAGSVLVPSPGTAHMAVVDWGVIMAAGVMVTIPALIFFVAIQRDLIAG